MITRKQLEAYTLLKLQELQRQGITIFPTTREECIDKILSLSKRKAPSKNSIESQIREAGKSSTTFDATAFLSYYNHWQLFR